MKVYYSKGACSLAVRIIVNELKLPVDFISVNLKDKKTEYGDDYFKINPKGAVPAIETDDGKVLTENAVIQQYLADTKHAENLLPLVGNFQRYVVLEWVNYIATEVHKGYGMLFNSQTPDEVKMDITIPNLMKKFAYLNQAVGKNKFLMGDSFTLPDAYLVTMLYWAQKQKLDLSEMPELNRYYKDMQSYPAVQNSFSQEGLI